MKHYGRVEPAEADIGGMIERIRATPRSRAMAVLVIDAMDIEGTTIQNLAEVLGHGRDVLVVVNKCDLLPPRTSFARLRDWVRVRLRQLGIRVGKPARDVESGDRSSSTGGATNVEQMLADAPEKSWHARRAAKEQVHSNAMQQDSQGWEGTSSTPASGTGAKGTSASFGLAEEVSVWDVLFCSARTGEGTDDVTEWLQSRRFGRDVFMVGSVNVGKSTLINRVAASAWE